MSTLAEVGDASDDTWESIKDGMESIWDSMKSAFNDTVEKIRK